MAIRKVQLASLPWVGLNSLRYVKELSPQVRRISKRRRRDFAVVGTSTIPHLRAMPKTKKLEREITIMGVLADKRVGAEPIPKTTKNMMVWSFHFSLFQNTEPSCNICFSKRKEAQMKI